MSFKTSNIVFGGYTFPAGFAVHQLAQDSKIEEVKIPFLDGTSAPPGSRSSKTVRIIGYVGGWGAVDSSGNYITSLDEAENEAQLLYSNLAAGYQALTAGYTPARAIQCQKQKMRITPAEGAGRLAIEMQIDFLAQDPRWLATAQSTLAQGSGGTNNAVSNGTATTYPVLTIEGPFTNPTYKITPAGSSGYVQVAPVITLASTDTLVIDSDPRNRPKAVLLNGVARLDLLGTAGITNTVGDSAFFPYLKPGTNSVTTSASSGTGTFSLAWYDAWL